MLVTDVPDVQADSILGYAAIGARSYQYCMLRIGQELAARGHTFTLLVSDLENLSVNELGSKGFPGLNIVAFSGPPGIGTKEWYEQLSRDLTTGLKKLQHEMISGAHHLYSDKATLQKLFDADYDVLLRDAMYWPAALLDDVLGIPSIDVLSAAPFQPLFGYYTANPNPVAYLPQLGSGLTPDMLTSSSQRQFMRESGLRVRVYEQGYSTSVAAIFAADWALEYPHPVSPKVHMVGAIMADDANPLPVDLRIFLEQGDAEPVRSTVCSTQSHPVEENMSLEFIAAANIRFTSWAPQNDVLGLPALKAFITHAGSNSIHEATYHGKPVVCIPLLADQFDQAARAEYHGFGLTVMPAKLTSSQPMSHAIKRILSEPQFMANAQKVQKRLSNRPRHPAQLAADIVEHVIATGGDPYLATKMHSLSWWQLSLLDVKLFLAAAGAVMCSIIGGLAWLVWKLTQCAVKRCLGSTGQSQQQVVHNKMN
ncbi:TPA: UDP-glucuronosyltransferase 2A1 [Trebouxia sp. C0004]